MKLTQVQSLAPDTVAQTLLGMIPEPRRGIKSRAALDFGPEAKTNPKNEDTELQ